MLIVADTGVEISELNRARWSRASSAREYVDAHELFPAERVLLGMLRKQRADWDVLDIGVGGGRTCAALTGMARRYLGIDYSPQMVGATRERYPHLDIRQMDARHLDGIADGQFDLVCFSFNGIDYVTHQDRCRVLAEIRRVLAPDGVLYFSSHNRDYAGLDDDLQVRMARLSPNPLRSAVRVGRYLRSRLEVHRLRSREQRHDEYLLLNDPEGGVSFLTYYIGVPHQIAQLASAGFRDPAAFDFEGCPIAADRPHRSDPWVHYLARG